MSTREIHIVGFGIMFAYEAFAERFPQVLAEDEDFDPTPPDNLAPFIGWRGAHQRPLTILMDGMGCQYVFVGKVEKCCNVENGEYLNRYALLEREVVMADPAFVDALKALGVGFEEMFKEGRHYAFTHYC